MRSLIILLGRTCLDACTTVGARVCLFYSTLWYLRFWGRRGLRIREAVFQMARLGVRSIPLVVLVNLLIGAIIAVSLSTTLKELGVLEWICMVTAVVQVRELGPLMTALMMSGFTGAAIAAEIGSMAVSEELVALEAQAFPSEYFLVAPRLAGMIVMMPCLTLIADFSGILGGFLIGVGMLDIAPDTYYQNTIQSLTNADLWRGILIKSEVFAAIITITACHLGITARGGAQGVGNATIGAVVQSIVLIIAANLIMTILFNYTLSP